MPSKAGKSVKAGTKAAVESTREQLIEVGLELMRKRGYGASGLNEILAAAHVPKGSFYHHFGSKELFAAAVLERYVALETEHGRKVLTNAPLAPLKRLRRYFEDLVVTAGQAAQIPGCLMGSLSLEVAAVSPILQDRLRSSFAVWQSSIAAVLREAVEEGDLPASTRVEALAGFMLNSWEGALLRSQADRSDVPLKEFLRYVFEELLRK